MIPISVMVTGVGTTSFRVKGRFGVGRPSDFSAPLRPIVSWNITRRCNLKCLHCYIDAGPAEAGELSTEEALRLVDQMAEVGVPLILFTGGEPLARPDFFQIAARAGELGIKLVLSTNGTLITPDVAKRLKELGFVYVGVSLDSIDERFHDAFRGMPGSFAAALAGIKNALVAGLDVGLRFTVTAKNIHEVGQYVDFAAALGVRRITFYHLSAAGRAQKLPPDWWYTPEQYRQFMETLIAKARQYAGRLEIETTLAPFDGIYLALMLGNGDEQYLKFVESTGGCGRKIISIYPNGDVYPCQFIDFYKLGNVREKPLKEILTPDKLEPFIHTEKYLRGPKCSACPYKQYCKGGDRARAHYLTGDTFGDDPLCPIPSLLLNKPQQPKTPPHAAHQPQ
jgi:radical SAM protein with 4Fe4S-binding SPASM domain